MNYLKYNSKNSTFYMKENLLKIIDPHIFQNRVVTLLDNIILNYLMLL